MFHKRVSLASLSHFGFLCLAFALIIGVVLTYGIHDAITCPDCGGKGEVWEMWYDFDVGTWVQGYRTCSKCDGTGLFWIYTVSHSTFLVSFLSILVFLGLFAFEHFRVSLWLDRNPWVRDVEDMNFWFNPMYFTWLFYKDRRRWVKWNIAGSLVGAIVLVVVFGSILFGFSSSSYLITRMTPEVFWKGCIFGSAFATLLVAGLHPILWSSFLKL